jgi:hypothetical protein
MKPLITLAVSILLSGSTFAAPDSVKGRNLTDLNVVPAHVLQRSVSPKFYKSLLVSPLDGWITVRANLSGTHLSGAKIVRSDLKGAFDPLAFQLAKEAQVAGNFTLDRPNTTSSVLLHLLVYEIADGTMVLSFVHFDGPGGDQMQYYGCARLLVLQGSKWTEIKGPASLDGKGIAVRQGIRNDLNGSLKMEGLGVIGAEATNMR